MAQTETARYAKLSVKYKGKNLNSTINSQTTSFTYTDVASGSSDSIDISIRNCDKKWITSWLPKKKDKIVPNIILKNWTKNGTSKTFKCGTFAIDDLSFSGRPLTGKISAVSQPAGDGFSVTNKTKTWKSVTIKEIAKKIASSANITLVYEAGSIKIEEIEQSSQPNSTFLYNLCETYGLAMKVYNNKLVIYDEEKYEKKRAVTTIDETNMESWSYNDTITGTYTGAKLSYTDSDSDETITVTVGTSGRMYECSAQAYSKHDAKLKATAAVNKANKEATTMSVTIPANPKIIASCNVRITGLGKLNGKYFVDAVKHTLGSGYKMSLTMHKVKTRISA